MIPQCPPNPWGSVRWIVRAGAAHLPPEVLERVGAPQSPFMAVDVTGWICGSQHPHRHRHGSPGEAIWDWEAIWDSEALNLCFVASGVPEPVRGQSRKQPLKRGRQITCFTKSQVISPV